MRLAAASVCVKELPSGNQRSMMTSGRLDSGKLFGHVGEGRDADAEQRHRADDDGLAMLNTRIHPTAQPVVERCIEQVLVERTAVRPDLEHQKAQVGA